MHPIIQQFTKWLTHEDTKARASELKATINKAFTEHPKATGESYLQHLWFTLGMSIRLVWAAIIILIHGIFPFLLTRTASSQVIEIFRIMKNRIPKATLEKLEAEEHHYHGA